MMFKNNREKRGSAFFLLKNKKHTPELRDAKNGIKVVSKYIRCIKQLNHNAFNRNRIVPNSIHLFQQKKKSS